MNSIHITVIKILALIILSFVIIINIADCILSTELAINESCFGELLYEYIANPERFAVMRKNYKNNDNFFKIGIPFVRLPKLGTIFLMLALLILETIIFFGSLILILHNNPYIFYTIIVSFCWLCVYVYVKYLST